jgi:hypothetical protein
MTVSKKTFCYSSCSLTSNAATSGVDVLSRSSLSISEGFLKSNLQRKMSLKGAGRLTIVIESPQSHPFLIRAKAVIISRGQRKIVTRLDAAETGYQVLKWLQ